MPEASSLELFLADLWEQADMMRDNFSDPKSVAILDELQQRLVALALVAQVAALTKDQSIR